MLDRPVRLPGPDHPITVTPSDAHVVVTAGGRIVADTRRALKLQEANYPPVWYIPRDDADMRQFQASPHTSYCPYKGEASYFTLPGAGVRGTNAVWSYEAPYASVAAIGSYLAFYPDRIDSIAVA